MLFEEEIFNYPTQFENQFDDAICRYCTIENVYISTGGIDASFLFCTFSKVEIYSLLFNQSIFVECQFEDCVFQGISFSGCRFVDCSFVRCHFVQDNQGSECSFDDTKWYGCTQKDCKGLGELVPSVS